MDKEPEKLIQYISLKQASEISGYHPDYLSYLIRKGRLEGKRVGRAWLTTKEAVFTYLSARRNKRELPLKKVFSSGQNNQDNQNNQPISALVKKEVISQSRSEPNLVGKFIFTAFLSISLIFIGFILGQSYFDYSGLFRNKGNENILREVNSFQDGQDGTVIPKVVVNVYPQNSSDITSQIRSVLSSLADKEISSRILNTNSIGNLKY